MEEYDCAKAIEYAHKWAYARNPAYYNFDGIGGDCTNFISQCLFAGCSVMNYTRDTGWYYTSLNDRSAAWTSVEYLYRFLTKNRQAGPYAEELPLTQAQHGDIIQLSFDGQTYNHSLFVVGSDTDGGILIATHTDDSDNRPLSSYSFIHARLLHICGVRKGG